MKKTIQIMSIILVIATIFSLSMCTISMADETASSTIDALINNKGENTPEGISKLGGTIINVVTTVAMIISIIMLLLLGIKYMMGSTAEKAEYKKSMIPYLVGAILVFGASGIAKFVISIADTASKLT